jgi:hypothetical protein
LGETSLKQRRFAEAEKLLRESIRIRESFPADWQFFDAKCLLGGALLGQQKYPEATPPLVQGYEGMKAREQTIPAPQKGRLSEALKRLVRLYEATGQQGKAEDWRK